MQLHVNLAENTRQPHHVSDHGAHKQNRNKHYFSSYAHCGSVDIINDINYPLIIFIDER